MKKTLRVLLLLAGITLPFFASAYNDIWQQVDGGHVPSRGEQAIKTVHFNAYSLNTQYMHDFLFALSTDPAAGQLIELPMADGNFRTFKVWQSTMIPAALAAKYPNIRTFTAEATDNRNVTAKLDYTEYGFHAVIFDGNNTSMIDPYSKVNDGFYMAHYKRDDRRNVNDRMLCQFKDADDMMLQQNALQIGNGNSGLPHVALRTVYGYQLRTYRLALSCTGEYAVAVAGATPTKPAVLSAMVTSVNRVNGVYEREFSITMTLIPNEDTLIFLNGATDPFTNGNGGTMLGQNQTTVTTRVGSANYDIGHVFSTGGGGVASLGCVCNTNSKAQGVTGSGTPIGDGFDIDYVAHEMGHQFGGDHSFNNNADGSCQGNANQSTAYEVGSGSTIMAYAGICSPDDVQPHSDAYFHAANLVEITNYTNTGTGNTCPVKTPTGNKPVGLANFTSSYVIPYKTPFELISPVAVDSVADTSTTYCWEQWNLGDFGARLVNTHFKGPIFRSFNPTTSTTRVFPRIDSVLKGVLTYVSTGTGSALENHEGEKVPDTARFLTFKLTVRDILNGNGCILFPDDTIHLNVINTGAGFKVTSPATAVTWAGNSTQTVTWNVVNTNAAPISCDSVNIYLSTNGGFAWPTLIGRFANTGTASITVPNIATTTARIKVKGNNNVFFNVNAANFTITAVAGQPPAQPGPIAGPDTVCANSIVTYTVAPDSTATSYTWTLPAGWSGTSTTNTIVVTTGTTGGTISVTANNANGSSTPRTFTVFVRNVVATITPAGPITLCSGSSTVLSANTGVGLTYQWQLNGAPINGATGATFTASQTGNYSVVVTQGGCSATSNTVVITVNPIPVAGSNSPVCVGSTVTLTGSTAPIGFTYTWTGPNGYTANTQNATIPNAQLTNTGIYTLTVTSIALNCSASDTAMVVVTNGTAPAQPGPISGNAAVCAGSTQTYSVSPVAGATSYSWVFPGGWSGTSSTNTITTIAGASGGTIMVTANAACGTSTPQTLAVTVGSAPTSPGVIGSIVYCLNSVATQLTANGTNLLWYTTATGGTGNATAPTPSTNVPGTTAYYVSQSNGGVCESPRAIILVTVDTLPTPNITLAGLTLSTTGVFSGYQWYLNGSGVANGNGTIYTATQNGTYYLVVSDTNGCHGQSNSITIAGLNISSGLNGGLNIGLYPNPNDGTFTLSGVINTDDAKVQMEIIDVTGKVIVKDDVQVTNRTINYPVSMQNGVATGVYLLRLSSGQLNTAIPFVKR